MVQNKVILDGEYTGVFMQSGENICPMVGYSNIVLNGAVNGHEKVLTSANLLAVWCLLNEVK